MNGIAFKHVGALAMVLALGIGGPAMSNEQLRQNVENQLAEHSITVDNLGSLTNTQLAQIQLLALQRWLRDQHLRSLQLDIEGPRASLHLYPQHCQAL